LKSLHSKITYLQQAYPFMEFKSWMCCFKGGQTYMGSL
jgi:hypothetical protein